MTVEGACAFVLVTARPEGGRSRGRRPHESEVALWHTIDVSRRLHGSVTSLKLSRFSVDGVLHKHERFENQLNFAAGLARQIRVVVSQWRTQGSARGWDAAQLVNDVSCSNYL